MSLSSYASMHSDYINQRLIGSGLTLQRGPGGNRAHASIVMTSEVNKRSGMQSQSDYN